MTLNREGIRLLRPYPRNETELGTRTKLAAMAEAIPNHPEWLGRAEKIQQFGVAEVSDKGTTTKVASSGPKRD